MRKYAIPTIIYRYKTISKNQSKLPLGASCFYLFCRFYRLFSLSNHVRKPAIRMRFGGVALIGGKIDRRTKQNPILAGHGRSLVGHQT